MTNDKRKINDPSRLFRESERDIGSPRGRAAFTSAGRDYDKLATVHLISRGRGVSGNGQRRLPEQLPGCRVEGAKLLVVICCADKDQPAGRDDRPAVVPASGVAHSLSRQLRMLAERNLPGDRAFI